MDHRQLHTRLSISFRLQRLLDPVGSGYRSETGGLMEALRVLTPDQSEDSMNIGMAVLGSSFQLSSKLSFDLLRPSQPLLNRFWPLEDAGPARRAPKRSRADIT